uniref:Uncharacterized protein n=1 Tax=Lepeophtheirus salmonis TaxID=72036 RepID=A0A0K2V070_LEPSM
MAFGMDYFLTKSQLNRNSKKLKSKPAFVYMTKLFTTLMVEKVSKLWGSL